MKAFVLTTTTLLSALHLVASRLCCKKGVYSLTINLEQTCANSRVEGFTPVDVVETSCMTTILPPFEEQGILLERVRRVDIYELGPNFRLLTHQIIPGPLADGAVIEYESVVGHGGPSPNGIQVVVTAETSDGVSVMNLWTITYQNSCILPLFAPGATIGWTGVVSWAILIECAVLGIARVRGNEAYIVTSYSDVTGNNLHRVDRRD